MTKMNKEELGNRIRFLVSENSRKEMQLYAFEKGETKPYSVILTEELNNHLIDLFASSLREIFLEDEEYDIVLYSKADKKKGNYYLYDLETVPDSLHQMSELVGETNCEDYDFTKNNFDNLDYFILVFSDGNIKGKNKIVIYKQISQVEKIIKSKKSFLGFFEKGRLELFDKPVLRIGSKFQVIFISPNNYIILSDKFIEQKLGLYEIMKKEISKYIHKLEDKRLLLDDTELKKYITDKNIPFCRKLVKVLSTSKILEQDISKQDIFNFIKKDNKLCGSFVIEQKNGESFIKIKNNSMAKKFLNLLDDDFLYSRLTKKTYQVSAKDEM